MTMKKIAIYNQNCTQAGQRAWNAEENDGDVTWYDESDLSWALPLSKTEPANSNDLYRVRVAKEIVREFGE